MKKPVFSVTKKDFKVDYFSGTGAGGQHRNRHMNCVRLTHKDTGIMYTGQSFKERKSNLGEAFDKLTKDRRFRSYCQMRLVELERKETLDQLVDKMMDENNLKIEFKEGRKWVSKP